MREEHLTRLSFRDPLKVLMVKESRTCKGCVHEHRERAFGQDVVVCTRMDADGRQRKHGRRCKDYKEN
ncbi:hypothetical protein [Nitrosomonas sp. Nm58]|uniref:hypothetical protein n=1 Tax=Nitrosomonas sp. Nm58 TaxID=200126 RepID=UPI000897745D|nr:hypothetical protein [Nitrosomonas sp. Nm58]SDY38315.1 hypothetical protein SAMN05421754_100838 [Nitrosomonas sp. Nm58]